MSSEIVNRYRGLGVTVIEDSRWPKENRRAVRIHAVLPLGRRTPSLGGNIMELTTLLQAIALVITALVIVAGIWYVAAAVRPPPR